MTLKEQLSALLLGFCVLKRFFLWMSFWNMCQSQHFFRDLLHPTPVMLMPTQ